MTGSTSLRIMMTPAQWRERLPYRLVKKIERNIRSRHHNRYHMNFDSPTRVTLEGLLTSHIAWDTTPEGHGWWVRLYNAARPRNSWRYFLEKCEQEGVHKVVKEVVSEEIW